MSSSSVYFNVTDPASLTMKEKMLITFMTKEYTDEIAKTVLIPLVTQTSPISLRALDWAVVNWSKQYNIVCTSIVPGQITNIHQSYRDALRYWKRRLFDPFRRRSRVCIVIDNETYETTLGQANFALWTYHTGVLNYVMRNLECIEKDMNTV